MRIRVLLALVLFVITSATWPSLAASTPKRPSTTKSKTAKQKSTRHSKARARSRRRKPRRLSRVKIRRLHRTFVASEDLKPMAQQLLQTRSSAAFAGVERYARKHAHDEAGVLADLVLGYAHILDQHPADAISPLQQARPRAGDVADYVTYFLGDAEQAAGKSSDALAVLRDFGSKYPDSIFVRQAAIVDANALVATGDPATAVTILSRNRLPTQADVEFYLGQAQIKAGDVAAGADTLRHLYFSMPASAQADAAGDLLRSTPDGLGATYALQKVRADALSRAHLYRQAADAYRQLLPLAMPEDMGSAQVSLGGVLHKAGDDKSARKLLEQASVTGEANGERLFYLLEIARSDNDDDRFQQTLEQLRIAAPHSSWLEQGLLTAGNVYLLRNDYDHAIDYYRELRERFPQGRLASYANWKVAWLNLRQNRVDDASRGFERQIREYPDSNQVAAAMYWRARIAEENEHDAARARAYYAALVRTFPNYYYADLARERLSGSAGRAPLPTSFEDSLLKQLPRPRPERRVLDVDPPEDSLRFQKALLLHNAGLTDFAVKELRAAAAEGGAAWVPAEIARLYRDDQQYHRAIEVMKAAIPSYFAMEVKELPRPYWEDLFPRPFWSDLKRNADTNGLDPFLVASLIRQESEFNPNAVSNANALGLMQVLPSTGKKLARAERIRYFHPDSLLTPGMNLRLGTRYFRELVDHYNGNLPYALAAYNAGTNRVDAWLASGNFRDTAEFVESIPFTETREYVQAILRNASVYRQLYGSPAKTPEGAQ